MKKDQNILAPQITDELKAFRRMELKQVDGDILVAADKAKIGFDPERIQRLQMMRDLKRIVRLLGEKKPKSRG